jgi:hypothetical protein
MANKIDSDLRKALDGSAKAYSSGNENFFDYFTDDVTVYSINSSEPVIGLTKYRSQFRVNLRATEKRSFKLLKDDVQMVNEKQALAVRTGQIRQAGITFNVRQSAFWVNTDNGWKMKHLHTTLIGTPSAPVAKSADAISVLNERIATVAAVLGVAQ